MSRPYENLKFYQDICQIRKFVYELTKRFLFTHLRLVSQMRDAARSAKQNIIEGYRKGTIGEFIHSINISLGSLEELSGDIQDCREDKLITEEEYLKFSKLYQSASYLSTQYLKSAYKMQREGTWKTPGYKLRRKNNLKKLQAT